MKILKDANGNEYVSQQLRDFIYNIWTGFDVVIPDDKNIYFAKNTTINKLITDYAEKGFKRVIKRAKAEYVVIKQFDISTYPQYFDNGNLTDDDSKDVVYAIYNNRSEVKATIAMILDFITVNPNVVYVNQDKLNESINNGFIIDNDSYTSLKELIDSDSADNHKLATTMLINSDLKQNWEWILYLYFDKAQRFNNYDDKSIIRNYFQTLNLSYTVRDLTTYVDRAMSVIKNTDVRDKFISRLKSEAQERIQEYFKSILDSEKIELLDIKIKYNG